MWTKKNISVAVLVIFHCVGLIGIGLGIAPEMRKLSWMNLVLTGGIVFFNRTEFSTKFYLYSLSVFLIGLTVEIIGVATGFPFGSYYYGDSLGIKLLHVPIVLGLNWWILVYASTHAATMFFKKLWVRVIAAPAIMLLLDFTIEPLCETLGFWYWRGSHVPLENYISWYLIALVLIAPYLITVKNTKVNQVSVIALLIQFLFFLLLNLLL